MKPSSNTQQNPHLLLLPPVLLTDYTLNKSGISYSILTHNWNMHSIWFLFLSFSYFFLYYKSNLDMVVLLAAVLIWFSGYLVRIALCISKVEYLNPIHVWLQALWAKMMLFLICREFYTFTPTSLPPKH